MGILKRAVHAAVSFVETAVDRLSDPLGEQVMRDALRKSSARGIELFNENQRLLIQADIMTARLNELQDRFRFNGPTLYRDEVEALQTGIHYLYGDETNARDVLKNLLGRSDHMPLTADEFAAEIHSVVNGTSELFPWDEALFSAQEIKLPERCSSECTGGCQVCRAR